MIEYPYYMSARILSRKKGHSAIAAAAYRSGQRLVEGDSDQGKLKAAFDGGEHITPDNITAHDYRRRDGVMSAFIMAPKSAPAWMGHRQRLWNEVELAEKRKDAQLAREVIVSLPDLDIFDHLKPENKAKRLQEFYERMLRRYVNDNFVKDGMVADVALHMPGKKNDKRHYHAHIMLSTRAVNETGFGQKERSWNAPEKLEGWRKSWSFLVNETLKQNGIEGFVDHRSYEERGLDIAATKPMGSYYGKLEHMGIKTPVGNDNRKIKAENREGHKYLERVFEHAPSASEERILNALEREGFAYAQGMKDRLIEEGVLIPLYSKETGFKSAMFGYAPLQARAEKLRRNAAQLHKRADFTLPDDVVGDAMKQRGDKMVRDTLSYVAQPEGFKVVEAEQNGHQKTFLKSCKAMYESAGYDVISVARTNEGKSAFKAVGITKGVLTYRDFLRRFGERYTGAKSTKKKVVLVDDADQLSPLQDQEIFNTARKIGAKLIYIGRARSQKKRHWQSMFGVYKMMSAFKKLRHKFLKSGSSVKQDLVRTAFAQARTFNALKMQGARYLHAGADAASAREDVLQMWFKRMKKKDDRRFILTAKDKDAHRLNMAIQQERLRRKHLKQKNAKMFKVAYNSYLDRLLQRDISIYWGDMIQFKKSYKDIGIEEGTRARVLIHYADHSILETDAGKRIRVDLQKYNGFDLGYAGNAVSDTDHTLEEGFIYHSSANALDDAPLLFQKTDNPIHIFYDENQVADMRDLSGQLLGRRHNIIDGFSALSASRADNDNDVLEDNVDESDENRIA